MELDSEYKSQKKTMSRRSALKTLTAAGGTIVFGSWLATCGSGPTAPAASQAGAGSALGALTIDLTQPENKALATVGGSVALDSNPIDAAGIFLYRESNTNVIAFSRKCTHQGCPVEAYKNGIATCPCHGSQFDLKGQPQRGPAGSPLKRYPATLSGTEVIISHAT